MCIGEYRYVYLCTWMWRPKEDIHYLSLPLSCLILLDTKPEHAGLVVGWLVSELPGSTSLCQTKMGFLVDVATPRLLHGCWGFKLRISCLHSTHSYPLHPCCLALALLLLFTNLLSSVQLCSSQTMSSLSLTLPRTKTSPPVRNQYFCKEIDNNYRFVLDLRYSEIAPSF